MTRATALPTLFAAVLVCVGCDDASEKEAIAPEPKSHAIAEYSPGSKIDLGKVVMKSDGDIHDVVFEVKNTGTAPLEISKIFKSCQCSTAEADQKTVAPGASTKIRIGVKVKHPGPKHVYLTAYTNSKIKPEKSFEIAWDAIGPYEVDTEELDFGDVIPNTKYERKIRFTPESGGACVDSIPAVAEGTQSDRLTADITESGVISVTLMTGPEPGRHAEELQFAVNGCWKEKFSIPVRWDTQPPVTAKPDFLFLNNLKRGEKVERRVVISSVTKSELQIEPIETEDVSIKWEPIGKSRLKGTLTFTAPDKPGRFNKRISIPIVQPKSEPLVISIAGSVAD